MMTTNQLLRIFVFAGASVAAGCSTDDQAGDTTAAFEAAWRLRALTYNAALAPAFEPYAAEREPWVISALADAAKHLDLACVQEFWREPDFADLRHAIASDLPYALRPEPRVGAGTCSADEFAPFAECAQSKCSVAGDGLVPCLQEQCTSQVQALSGGCVGCLINRLDHLEQCLGTSAEVSDPAIFDGDFDVGLFSRYPMLEMTIQPLDAYLQRGSLLHAEVEIPNLGPVHVFCTHLSSPLGVIPYAGPYHSWQGEHRRETTQLVDFITLEANDGAPVLVMGDLNMGFALNGQGGVSEDDFRELLGRGLEDPLLSGGSPACTECRSNTFHRSDSTEDLVDHLLIAGFPSVPTSVARAFTSRVSVVSAGNTVSTNLSDHYGLRLTMSSR